VLFRRDLDKTVLILWRSRKIIVPFPEFGLAFESLTIRRFNKCFRLRLKKGREELK